jgi:predicted nucleic acid-binding protein
MPPDAELLALDTSVAVPLLAAHLEAHDAVRRWRGERPVRLCGHAHLEVYAVLTRLPGEARVAPDDAVTLMAHELEAPITLSPAAERQAPALLAAAGISGGATYDGLVALAAKEHGATLVSRDARAEANYRRIGATVLMLPAG